MANASGVFIEYHFTLPMSQIWKCMVNAFNRIIENVHETRKGFVIYGIFGNKIVYWKMQSNEGISPLLKAQRNRQIFTVNLEQEIEKGIGREKLLKIDLFWKNKCFLGLTENGPKGNDESLQNLQSIITCNYNALERKEEMPEKAAKKKCMHCNKLAAAKKLLACKDVKVVYGTNKVCELRAAPKPVEKFVVFLGRISPEVDDVQKSNYLEKKWNISN
ncbi:hypothetical protein HELRODRAFT_178212 [Helobdella robusta]|uniref:Uncharacterized protein n=1 Tax=Helobdella robusta TaxID=6412 RepID=T1FCY2_HELRO|nr:hypothetical protein HELRODRAFT_178212 [Helobdella robusta]ESN97420.1 hypothetical protein HELRODRAFT_178212 [Helobdella robusta]